MSSVRDWKMCIDLPEWYHVSPLSDSAISQFRNFGNNYKHLISVVVVLNGGGLSYQWYKHFRQLLTLWWLLCPFKNAATCGKPVRDHTTGNPPRISPGPPSPRHGCNTVANSQLQLLYRNCITVSFKYETIARVSTDYAMAHFSSFSSCGSPLWDSMQRIHVSQFWQNRTAIALRHTKRIKPDKKSDSEMAKKKYKYIYTLCTQSASQQSQKYQY